MEERLQKLLAQAGLCSRREAERWIDDGRVTVNGKKASVGDKADPRRDKIFVDGKPIGGAEEKVYLMLYKPRGYVTTMKDEHGRKTVADLVRGCGARVVPVGSSGLQLRGSAAADQRRRSAQRADPSAPRRSKSTMRCACAAIWKTSRNSQSRWRLTASASVRQRLLPLTVTKSARSCA